MSERGECGRRRKGKSEECETGEYEGGEGGQGGELGGEGRGEKCVKSVKRNIKMEKGRRRRILREAKR